MDDEQSEEWPATDWDESASDARQRRLTALTKRLRHHPKTPPRRTTTRRAKLRTTAQPMAMTRQPTQKRTKERRRATRKQEPHFSPLSASEAWTLPIRAAPILALQGEEVIEFPLSQHRSGLESTSRSWTMN